MSAAILRFPLPDRPYHGTVRVMGDKLTGFQVGHESASGNSWGHFSGPYDRAQDAIDAAAMLNRDHYRGGCDITICDAALEDRDVTPAPCSEEGF